MLGNNVTILVGNIVRPESHSYFNHPLALAGFDFIGGHIALLLDGVI